MLSYKLYNRRSVERKKRLPVDVSGEGFEERSLRERSRTV